MSTSQKHRNFVAEPMGDKPVTDLAGIGEVLGTRLKEAGFDKVSFTHNLNKIVRYNLIPKKILHLQAFVVLGQYLVLKKNKDLFQEWMKDVCQANSKQSTDCYQCLSDWCEEFL